jgi:uracil-DNA glycosylase
LRSAGIERLAEQIRACTLCRDAPRGRPLPHTPRPVVVASTEARILIAGQAPGTKVHASGIPFDDASGDRLRDWLRVTRAEFYNARNFATAPMGFCFPGQDAAGSDLPPRRECAPAWRTQLMQAMPQIDLVLAIGGYAQAWHLGRTRPGSVTATVETWREVFEASGNPRVIPLPHPSWRNTGWIRKHPWFETELLPFLRHAIDERLGRGDWKQACAGMAAAE